MTHFALNQVERQDALWKKIQVQLVERLNMLRLRNDGNLSPDVTAKTRGRIAEVKRMLAFGDPDAASELDDHDS